MEGYIGELKMFVGTFAPLYWQFCWGQSMPISQYNSLYAIIGTQFGGDGVNNFNLPDLRGRIPIGAGNGPGLTPRTQAQFGGAENVTLTTGQLPQHSHTVKCDTASTPTQVVASPQNNLPAVFSAGKGYGATETGNPLMKSDMINTSGTGQPHENMPPWGCVNYIICVEGTFPPRD